MVKFEKFYKPSEKSGLISYCPFFNFYIYLNDSFNIKISFIEFENYFFDIFEINNMKLSRVGVKKNIHYLSDFQFSLFLLRIFLLILTRLYPQF